MTKNTTKYILVIIFLFVLGCQSAIAKNDNRQKDACSLQWLSTAPQNVSGDFKKKSFDSTKYSTEGAHIDTYYFNDALIKIEVFIYGETSKTQIKYVFKSAKDYVVNYTRYHYSSPIYIKNSQTLATSSTKYLVCNGKLQKVVDQADIQKTVDNTEQLLKDIFKQLN